MRRDHKDFSAFLQFAQGKPASATRHSRDKSDKAKAWTGTDTFDEAMRLANDGWTEGRELIAAYSAKFSAVLGSRLKRPVLSRAVAGFSPDVGAFLSGEPECMFSRETTENEAPGRVLSLVVNGGGSAGISAGNIMQRGAMIIALVDALENAGYSCQLTAAFFVTQGNQSSADLIPVKAAGEPLEMDRVAFIFAHPAMLRRLVFSCREQDAPFITVARATYGSSQNPAPQDQGDLYFPRSYLGDTSDATLVTWFKSQIAALGIELSAE